MGCDLSVNERVTRWDERFDHILKSRREDEEDEEDEDDVCVTGIDSTHTRKHTHIRSRKSIPGPLFSSTSRDLPEDSEE